MRMGFIASLMTATALFIAPVMAKDLKLDMIKDFGTTPESCVFGDKGEVYVSVIGTYGQYGDGYIGVVDGKTLKPVARNLNDPHGLDFWKGSLFTADNRGQIWKIGLDGKTELMADSGVFPRKITNFNDIEIDPGNGDIYVSDSGEWEGRGGAVYKITQDKQVSLVLSDDTAWAMVSPNGLLLDGKGNLLVYDWTTAVISKVDLATKAVTKLSGSPGQGDGLAFEPNGSLVLSAYFKGIEFREKDDATKVARMISLEDIGLKSVADIAVSPDGSMLCAPDFDGSQVALIRLKP
jgi:DNA-binding beta-propeller fold protein YncE